MRKGVKVLLGCSLVISMIAGCSSGKNDTPNKDNGKTPSNFNASGYPIVQQKVTLKMMGLKGPIQGPWDQMFFFKEMEDKTNIHFEFDTPPSDSYTEKKKFGLCRRKLSGCVFSAEL